MISRNVLFVILATLLTGGVVYFSIPERRLQSNTREALGAANAAPEVAAPKSIKHPLNDIPEPSIDDLSAPDDTSDDSVSGTPTPRPNPIIVSSRSEDAEDAVPPLTPTASPLVDTLRALQPQNNAAGTDQIFGGRTTSSAPAITTSNFSQSSLSATPTPAVSPTPLGRVGGQATGYSMLYLMQLEARAAVEKEIEILLDSQVNNLYLAVLVDGTFSIDFPYLRDVIQRLNADGRTLTLVLYFANGPTMRHNLDGSTAGFNGIDPITFRSDIEGNSAIQNAFRARVSLANSSFDLNTSLNPANKNFAIIMLEDNLDDSSYVAMRRIANAALNGRALFVRNPCPECITGNSTDSLGDGIESHNPNDIGSTRLTGYSLDGLGYAFPGEPMSQGPSFDTIKQLKAASITQGLQYFGLWRFGRQGLGSEATPPNERNYEIPTDDQKALDIELLRTGLLPVDSGSSSQSSSE